jgi:hypothetical protein
MTIVIFWIVMYQGTLKMEAAGFFERLVSTSILSVTYQKIMAAIVTSCSNALWEGRLLPWRQCLTLSIMLDIFGLNDVSETGSASVIRRKIGKVRTQPDRIDRTSLD